MIRLVLFFPFRALGIGYWVFLHLSGGVLWLFFFGFNMHKCAWMAKRASFVLEWMVVADGYVHSGLHLFSYALKVPIKSTHTFGYIAKYMHGTRPVVQQDLAPPLFKMFLQSLTNNSSWLMEPSEPTYGEHMQ